MTVMRRSKGWAFVAWVHDGDGGRRQMWRGDFRTKAGALSTERGSQLVEELMRERAHDKRKS